MTENLDLRNLNFEIKTNSGIMGSYEVIDCNINGNEVGYLEYSIYEEDKTLKIDMFEIDEKYQNLGIGQLFYKEFGKTYEQKYNGWGVARYFVNPVAEYSFRKAVSLGWVSEKAITNDLITRQESEENNELWQDLRNKLPENLRGPKQWAITKDLRMYKFANTSVLDMRQISVEHSIEHNSKEVLNDVDAKKYSTHFLELFGNEGVLIGFIQFSEIEDAPADLIGLEEKIDGRIEKMIYIELVQVADEFQMMGAAYKIYEEFGKFYSENFSGWPVSREFMNPVAEYSFRKAVEKGLVPEETLIEDLIKRIYNEEDQNKIIDLRNKLNENVRGPEQWAKTNDFRMKKLADDNQFTLDDLDVTYQNTTINKPEKAKAMISHEIYVDYKEWQIGYLHFTEYHDVDINNINEKYPNKQFDELLCINNVLIHENYRGWNISELLYEKFGEIYNSQFKGWQVAQYFVNPIAEYVFRKAVKDGIISKEALTEDLILQKYKDQDKELWQELEDKLKTKQSKLRKVVNKFAEMNDIDKFLSMVQIIDTGIINGNREISAIYEQQNVGYMKFIEHTDDKNLLEITELHVEPQYEETELKDMILEYFGSMYDQEYYDWKVALNFNKPEDEILFRALVSSGIIPSNTLDNELVNRNYNEEQNERLKDLQETLPINYRGARRSKSRLKKQAFKLDLRTR